MKPLRICLVNAIAPPAAGSRAERWAFLMRELADRGHHVTCVRAQLPASFPRFDTTLENVVRELPIRQVVVSSGLPPRLQYNGSRWRWLRLAGKALSEVAWPDYWASFASRAIRQLAGEAGSFDVVITSGVPFSDHLVGYEMARVHGVPWVADYGDPWGLTLDDRGWHRNAHHAVESRLIRLASSVLVTTQATRTLFADSYDLPVERIGVLPAGVDARELPDPRVTSGLSLLHAGTVYGPRADVSPFLEAVDELAAERVRLTWFGELWRRHDRQAVKRVAVRSEPRVPYETVLETEAQSHGVVIFGNHGGVQIPAKLWRSAGTGRMLLGITADSDDAMYGLRGVDQLLLVENRKGALVEALRRMLAARESWSYADVRSRMSAHSWVARAAELEARAHEAVEAGSERAAEGHMPARALLRRHTWTGHKLVSRIDQILKNSRIVRSSDSGNPTSPSNATG